MEADKALRLLSRLEKKVGELYDHFCNVFGSDEKARELFEQLCLDEDSHNSVVQYQMRIVRKEPGAFGHVSHLPSHPPDTLSVQNLSADKDIPLIRRYNPHHCL